MNKHSTKTYTSYSATPSLITPTLNLKRLAVLRSIILLLITGLFLFGHFKLALEINNIAVWSIIIIQSCFTLYTHWYNSKNQVITAPYFFFQLVVDIVFIASLCYFTGGASNPLIAYCLVPLCIAAATLAWRYALIIALIAVSAYSLLLFYYEPLPLFSTSAHGAHHHHSSMHDTASIINAHIVGMWLNFLVSSILIAWFVTQMAKTIREQDKQQQKIINQYREKQLYDEKIMTIATLSAGATHEISTPLNSLQIITDEFEKIFSNASQSQTIDRLELLQDIQLMQSQIHVCKQSLQKLVRTAQQTHQEEKHIVNVEAFILGCINKWQPLRPEINFSYALDTLDDCQIRCDAALEQAIINLLNNAANASPHSVKLKASSTSDKIYIVIFDRGNGIPEPILNQPLSQLQQNASNSKGLSLGLFLSNASIKRHQGQLILENTESGAMVTIELPRQTES